MFVYVLVAAPKEEEVSMFKDDLSMTSPEVYVPRKPDVYLMKSPFKLSSPGSWKCLVGFSDIFWGTV